MTLSIKILNKSDDVQGYATSNLKLNISGSDINYIIINTLRRIALSLLGGYAFEPRYITINKNTSIFNNDYMRLRLSNIPIVDRNNILNNNEELLDKFIDMEILANESIFETKKNNLQELDEIEIKKKEMVNNLSMYIKAKNNTNDIMNVTTNELYTTFFIGGKKIPDIFPRELLIIKLKPEEEFVCSCVSDINIPIYNNIYSSCCIFSYEEINDNEFNITIESQRQITEHDILTRSCLIICKKLEILKNIIKSKLLLKPEGEYEAEIIIENENHTLGNLITRGLQDHKNIAFCGYKIDHPDVNELIIKYKTEGDKFTNILEQVINEQIKIYQKIIDFKY
jgi:DNA-directed RNA polymerase subunit L